MISKKDALEFPFLKDSFSLAKDMGIEMDTNTVYSDKEMCSMVDEYLQDMYRSRFYVHKQTEDFEVSLKRFVGACIVVNQVGKERMMHRFADFESISFTQKVEHKSKEMFPIYFNMVFQEVWGRPNFICKTKDGKHYAVKVPQYLQFKRDVKKFPEYLMINQSVVGGFVIFGRGILLGILQFALKSFLYDRVSNMFKDIPVRNGEVMTLKGSKFKRGIEIPPLLFELVKKFEYVDLHFNIYKSPPNKDIQDFNIEKLKTKVVKLKGTVPPCIAYLKRKFQGGEHVPHFERFVMMTFMLARGDSQEEILSLFEKSSNYKKDEIDYMLSHTKKMGYKTPNCSKINDNKICFRSSVCGSCANPLQLLGEVNMTNGSAV